MEAPLKKTPIKLCILFHLLYAWISFNAYLPAVNALSSEFHASATNIKFSLPIFTAAFSVSQLIWGPLSEIYGKRKMLLISNALSILGLVVVIFSNNLTVFNLGRVFEGINIASIGVIGRALLHEILETNEFGKTVSIYSAAAFTMPAVAPILGSFLLHYFGWRSIFVFLLIYNILLLIVEILFLKNLPPVVEGQRQSFSEILGHYFENLKNKKFMTVMFPYMVSLGSMMALFGTAPYLFMDTLGYTPEQYSYFTVAFIASYVLGTIFAGFLVGRNTPGKNLYIAISTMFAAFLGFVYTFIIGQFTVFGILLPSCLYLISCGMISPATNSAAMNVGGQKRCFTAATLTFAAYISIAVFTSFVMHLPLDTTRYLTLLYMLFILGTFLIFTFLKRQIDRNIKQK